MPSKLKAGNLKVPARSGLGLGYLRQGPRKRGESHELIWIVACYQEKEIHKIESVSCVGCGPLPVTVTFSVGNPYKPSFTTVTGRGPHPNHVYQILLFIWNTPLTAVTTGFHFPPRLMRVLSSRHQPNILKAPATGCGGLL